jgi:YHS domain-containing protein
MSRTTKATQPQSPFAIRNRPHDQRRAREVISLNIHHIVLAAVVLLFRHVGPAFAGGYLEEDGVAIGGYYPVANFTEVKRVKGSPEFHAVYEGSTFYFAAAPHRNAFVSNPARFAPRYGRFFAFGMVKGYKASIDPATFTLVGDKLYLNYNGTVCALWIFDIQGYVKKADQYWPEVRKTTAVTR